MLELSGGKGYYLKVLLTDLYVIVDDGLPALRKSGASQKESIEFMKTLAEVYTNIFNRVAKTNYTLEDWTITLEDKKYQFVPPKGILKAIDFIGLRGVMYLNVFTRYNVMESLANGDTRFIAEMKNKEFLKEDKNKDKSIN